jgi:site-specific DNA recombinase
MSVILYARVSDIEQGKRDLSIPAQLRAMRAHARKYHWKIAGEFTDIATGRNTNNRDGLLAGIAAARKSRDVDKFLVHKLDRFARNSMDYAILRFRLRAKGVELVSLVEHFDDSPLGHFMEQIMAAQAEFFSANLSLEVKKGLDEKLRRGEWCWMPPLGYVRRGSEILVDPVRGPLIRFAFRRFASGEVSSTKLADHLYELGLRGLRDQKIDATKLRRFLHNPFYAGHMNAGGRSLRGSHEALVTQELFEQVQEIFKKRPNGGRHVGHHLFPLARQFKCPKCSKHLIGESHKKSSGKIYRYYRCHTPGCSFCIRAESAEDKRDIDVA